jgi:hypothetical protein
VGILGLDNHSLIKFTYQILELEFQSFLEVPEVPQDYWERKRHVSVGASYACR